MFGFPSASKFSNARLRKGDVVVCELGGGGGYGDPLGRDPAKTEWDVLNGWVSAAQAREGYAVSIDAVTGRLDAEGTARLRREQRGT
jgi:N-methylhydantoinase B